MYPLEPLQPGAAPRQVEDARPPRGSWYVKDRVLFARRAAEGRGQNYRMDNGQPTGVCGSAINATRA
jgi:hypothetical protein